MPVTFELYAQPSRLSAAESLDSTTGARELNMRLLLLNRFWGIVNDLHIIPPQHLYIMHVHVRVHLSNKVFSAYLPKTTTTWSEFLFSYSPLLCAHIFYYNNKSIRRTPGERAAILS